MKKLSLILLVLMLICSDFYFLEKYKTEKSKNEVFLENTLNESVKIFNGLDEHCSKEEVLRGIADFNTLSKLFFAENKEYKNHFDGICQRMLIDTDLAKKYSKELAEIAGLLKKDENTASIKISELFNEITAQ